MPRAEDDNLNLCLNTSRLLPTNLRAVGSFSMPTIVNSPLTILFEVFSMAGRERALKIDYKFQLWHTKDRMISSRSICFRPGNQRVQENQPKMLRIQLRAWLLRNLDGAIISLSSTNSYPSNSSHRPICSACINYCKMDDYMLRISPMMKRTTLGDKSTASL